MSHLYQIIVLGSPTDDLILQLQDHLSGFLASFGLKMGDEVGWIVNPNTIDSSQRIATVALYIGTPSAVSTHLKELLSNSVPILPVVSNLTRVKEEIPEIIQRLNCLSAKDTGVERIASALLECIGLLPRQRRVFLSYRRDEARETALQLFDALSGRLFDVFLDTHRIGPSEDFQSSLWHRLCDSDVLLMLDTPSYFESRWTSAEFGRALAKEISVLSIGWPGTTLVPRASTASRLELAEPDVDAASGRLSENAIEQICIQLERVRSESLAVRSLNLLSKIRVAVEKISGAFLGIGIHMSALIELPDGRELTIFPSVGVPTANTLYEAFQNCPGNPFAVTFDPVGFDERWLHHLNWLEEQIPPARWIKSHEASWCLADWED